MDDAIGHYPSEHKRSAALPLLHLWQEHFGFISDEGVRWIAAKLELQPINILELVTFYPMLRQAPAGKKHIRVCRTLSCAMAGSYELMDDLCAATGIERHVDANGTHTPVTVSAEGNYSIEFVECLASCGTAPVCMIEDELVENARSVAASELLKERRSPDRRTETNGGLETAAPWKPNSSPSSTRTSTNLRKYRPRKLDDRHRLLPEGWRIRPTEESSDDGARPTSSTKSKSPGCADAAVPVFPAV